MKDAEQAVIDAKATYEQLVKAKANLETARQAYVKVVAAQDAAQVAYDKAVVALTNAKAQTALSGTKYTNLKAAYDARIAYEAAQRKAKEEAPLPQTGEADTAVYLLAGLGVLGLAGVTARKRRG